MSVYHKRTDGTFGLKSLDGCREPTDRPDFDSTTKSYFNNKKPLCHSFSFDWIASAICYLMRNYYKDALLLSNRIRMLATCLYSPGDIDIIDDTIQTQLRSVNLEDVYSKIDFANWLLGLFNNSVFNLRVGHQTWNSSVSNSFDPTSWAIRLNPNRDGSLLYTCQRKKCFYTDIPKIYGDPAGIYFDDNRDGIRLRAYKEFMEQINDDKRRGQQLLGFLSLDRVNEYFGYDLGVDVYQVKIFDYKGDPRPKLFPFVASSSNRFIIPVRKKPCIISSKFYRYSSCYWRML